MLYTKGGGKEAKKELGECEKLKVHKLVNMEMRMRRDEGKDYRRHNGGTRRED